MQTPASPIPHCLGLARRPELPGLRGRVAAALVTLVAHPRGIDTRSRSTFREGSRTVANAGPAPLRERLDRAGRRMLASRIARAAQVSATLAPEEDSALRAFVSTPAHEAVSYCNLPERLRGVADRLVARGLCRIVNGTVCAAQVSA